MTALAFSPDGHWLASGSSASGSDESEVLLWDLATMKHPAQPDYQVLSNVGLVAFEREARSFLALADGVVTRFDVDTLHPIEPLPEYGTNNVSLAVSWDGRWLAHAGTNGVVHLWDRDAPRERTAFCPYPGGYPDTGHHAPLGARTAAGRAARHLRRGAAPLGHRERPTTRALAVNQCAATRGL